MPDNAPLDALIKARNDCFERATDGGLAESGQAAFAERAERLSDLIKQLAEKNFEEATQNLASGNELQSIVTDLQREVGGLDRLDKNLGNVQKALSVVDAVIGIGIKIAAIG
jgi:NADP-dependent 3-hydroxy acid dehydrogenase YdfG